MSPNKERAAAALAALTEILDDLGLVLNEAKTRVVDLREQGSGFDFLGFQFRRLESTARKGKYWCARWPSDRSVRVARDRIREHTDRGLLMFPVSSIVERLNRFLAGWRTYYRWGNSAKVFHDLDYFVDCRVARFITNKHGRRGHRYGLQILYHHQRLGLEHLTGHVRYVTANAAR